MRRRRASGIQRFYGVLVNLGFSSYWDYLKSDQWRAIRQRVLDIHKGKCLFCPLSASQVHHLSYRRSVLLGNDLTKLVPLCRACHKDIEFTSDGTKRTIAAAKRQFYKQWKLLPPWIKRKFEAAVRRKR